MFFSSNLIVDFLFQSYQTDLSCKLSIPEIYERAKSIEKSLEDFFSNSSLDKYLDQLILIALHLNQRTYSGYYSLAFNAEMRNENLSPKIFLNLPRISKEYFYPEVYSNDILSIEERKSLIQRHNREFLTLKQTLLQAFDQYPSQSIRFFRSCDDIDLEDSQSDDIYSKCYNQICIQEKFGIRNALEDLDESTFSSPAITQIIEDGPPGQIVRTYCLPTKDLLISMVKDEINPLTGQKYAIATINSIRSKFYTELKLVEYALKISPKVYDTSYSCLKMAKLR